MSSRYTSRGTSLGSMVVMTAVALLMAHAAAGADRSVLGEYFNATW